MSDLKQLTLLASAARAWNNEDEPALDAAMEEIEIFLLERRTQPEATKPAQDLSAALKVARDGLEKISTWSFGWDGDCGVTRVAEDAIDAIEAALASSANALSAGDIENTPVFDLLKRAIGVIALHDDAEAKAIAADARAILQSQKDGHG